LGILFPCATIIAHAQEYDSIVVFGDSLSDTGNDADLTLAKYDVAVPGPYADYTYGRFTDGPDTYPAAKKYTGVWIEQLAAMLPSKPVVKASLNGGTDYAYGFATTGGGTGVFTLNASGSEFVTVNNMGLQITDYLATHPKINDKTLFVVWGGAINVLYATSDEDVIDGAVSEAADVERLIQAGAKNIVVPNLPPLGAVPRLNGSPSTSVPATEASVLFNDTLSGSLDIVEILEFFKDPHIYRLDVFSLLNSVIASPSSYYLDNVTDESQGVLTVNPDTYLFWDDLHPTTHGHDILALGALKLVDPYECVLESGPWMQPSCEAVH
jgi:phospholipase/lecithinase/hemolysin